METYKSLYTAGQFAKLHGINKRTLHYYDEIGLFSPAHKGENGYRYYTYLQSATLEILLTLRELNMSIEEIDRYMKHRSEQAFRALVAEKTAEIDENIKRLREMRKLLQRKESDLAFCGEVDLSGIELVEAPDEWLICSKSISGAYDESDFAVFVEHAQRSHGCRIFNSRHGCMISTGCLLAGDFESYDCFFTKAEKPKAGLFRKPAGRYIRAFCKGDWDHIPDAYRRILGFAEEQKLTLHGFAYEEGLNEMAIQEMDDYITMILVGCE